MNDDVIQVALDEYGNDVVIDKDEKNVSIIHDDDGNEYTVLVNDETKLDVTLAEPEMLVSVDLNGGGGGGSSAVTGVKGNAETVYRDGNVNISPTDIGLGNLTNNRQIKGLATGTTSNHVVVFGSDGYTVKDSGYTIGASVPANAKFTDTTYTPASATPQMDGTGAVGSSAKYAREDHMHPSDSTKVDKVSGKGLSTNDYTTSEKDKLASIEYGAENDIINGYPVEGADELSRGWLSKTQGGTALTPQKDKIYILMATTDNYPENTQFLWNGSTYLSLADAQVGTISNSDIEDIMSM